ncbi:MAG TPA: hypothetical protein VG273_17095 [Bryobacteraceae bacterium]|nr:hypothetical protein [Bryobacteraceae bacterium]
MAKEHLGKAFAGAGQIPEARAVMQSVLANIREAESARKLAPEEIDLRTEVEAKLAAWQ